MGYHSHTCEFGDRFFCLPDTLDPDKFDTMAWLMRQALADSSDIAFYKLRD